MVPPFNPGAIPSEGDASRLLYLPEPVSQSRAVVDYERCTVIGKYIFKESVQDNVPVHLRKGHAVVPGGRVDETVRGAFIPAVE